MTNIGTVIASYFSETSLAQRLALGDDIITRKTSVTDPQKFEYNIPLTACLLQELIGLAEPIDEKQKLSPSQISGVIYTDGDGITIQAAPGHGELVVNSKGAVDTYYVRSNNVISQEIRYKSSNIQPNQGRKLITYANNFETAERPSLDHDVVIEMAKVAREIKDQYGMRMDIEFVYDSITKTINLVQARAIPEGKRKGLSPCSLNPDLVKTTESLQAKVITTDVATAQVIEHENQILIYDDIKDALNHYLNLTQEQKTQIKAAIVKNYAPSTSHEAGMFSASGVVVMQNESLASIRKMLNDDLGQKPLIIDPQRKKIFKLNLEEIGDQPILAEGLFRSTLSQESSKQLISIFQEDSPNYIKDIQRGVDDRTVKQSNNMKLGDLITQAIQSKEAAKELFFEFGKMIGSQSIDALPDRKSLRQRLDDLNDFKQDPQLNKQNLRRILGSIFQLHSKVDPNLLKQTMVTGLDLYQRLEDRNLTDPFNTKEYFDVCGKFAGLIIGAGQKNLISTSIAMELDQAKKHQEFLNNIDPLNKAQYEGLEKAEDKESYYQLMAADKFLISRNDKMNWRQFIADSTSEGKLSICANLIGNFAKLDIHEFWLNNNFTQIYEQAQSKLKEQNDPDTAANMVGNVYKSQAQFRKKYLKDVFGTAKQDIINNAAKITELREHTHLIDELELNIGSWADPNKFHSLYEDLKTTIATINPILQISQEDGHDLSNHLSLKLLYRLVDVYDLSLKSLQTSHQYDETQKGQQVQNFKEMLGGFCELMQSHIEGTDYKQEFLDKIVHNFKNAKNDADQLLISQDLLVEKSNPFTTTVNEFDRTDWQNIKLADFHTIFHQSLIRIIPKKQSSSNQRLSMKLPNALQVTEGIKENIASLQQNIDAQDRIDTNTIILANLELTYPKITETINIPLRSHSCILEITHNHKTNHSTLNYRLNGEGAPIEINRWPNYEKLCYVRLNNLGNGIELKEHRSTIGSLNLSIDVQELSKVDSVIKTLNEVLQDSMIFHKTANYSKELLNINDQETIRLYSTDHRINFSEFDKHYEYLKDNPTASIEDSILHVKGINYGNIESYFHDITKAGNPSFLMLKSIMSHEVISKTDEAAYFNAVFNPEYPERSQILVNNSAKVSAEFLNTVLLCALELGDKQAVELILARNPHAIDNEVNGKTPVHYAAIHNRPKILKEILKIKPDATTIKDSSNKIALEYALEAGHSQFIMELLNVYL